MPSFRRDTTMCDMPRHIFSIVVCILSVSFVTGCESASPPPTREPVRSTASPQPAPSTDQDSSIQTPRETPPQSARVSGLSRAFSDGPIVGLWMTRWDYRTPTDVSQAIERAASLGVTDVFWQVRGQADAFYRSPFEPWGEELLADLPAGVTDPGFDPLELAVVQAHARGMRLHAWVNVMPLWKNKTPPRSKSHPFYTHPEWRLSDQTGTLQPLNDHYVIVNPVLDEVQDYLVGIIADIVDRYAVDGIHLDYIRFVSESLDQRLVYPGDPKSLALFAAASGRTGVNTEDDQRAFRAWKRNRITDLVRRIGTEAVRRRSGVAYTAAVWRDPTIGQVQYLQDGAMWLREGTLDAAMPMIYSDNDTQYRDDWQAWRQAVSGGRILPGIGAYKHNDPSQTIRQIRISSSPAGYALFAYASLFESANPLENKSPEAQAQRRIRRVGLQQFIKESNQDRSP